MKEVGVKHFGNICLVMGRVCHSQKVSDTPPTPWLLTKNEGKVVSAHCNCMAGLGEGGVCTLQLYGWSR